MERKDLMAPPIDPVNLTLSNFTVVRLTAVSEHGETPNRRTPQFNGLITVN